MKALLLITYFSMIIGIINGQNKFECHTVHEYVPLKSASCTDWNIYDPVDPFDTPIKTVRITFHIIQKNDGTGNFPDNSTARNWLTNTFMNHVNSRYTNFEEMNLPTSSPIITDSRIRFSLANIYFWQDNYGWSYQQTAEFGEYLFNKFVTQQSGVTNKDNSIHVFMSENANGKGRASDIGDKRWITVSGIYALYLANHWAPANLLNHELGHSLGLLHTWSGNDGCNDTPNNPNCWNVNEPPGCTPLSNNFMDYNACGCATTICQVNRMHYFLLGGQGNISDCLISGGTIQNPTLIGNDLICVSGATYTLDNLQLGVASNWTATPTNFFQTNSGCRNVANILPISTSVSGEGQINFLFDFQKFGTITVSKKLWVGKANQLNICTFDRSVYNANTISCPANSCQPMSVIVASGKSLTLIGSDITLNGSFEVLLGGTLELKTTGGCQ